MSDTIPPGYKITEVGVIPDDWGLATLQSLCVPNGLVRGPFGGALKKEFFVKRGYKVYEQRNAIYRNVEIGAYFIDHSKFRELVRFAVSPGDFIVSCSGTIGRIFQIPQNAPQGVINQALLKITTDSQQVNGIYFYKYFEWDRFQERILDNIHGGAMQNLVSMDVFRNVLIPLPPTLAEQRAIADALSEVDAEITALDEAIAKKRDLKQGVMQRLLTGEERLPGFTGAWEVKTLGEVVEFLDGQRKPIKSSHRANMRGIYPYYGASGIVDYVNDYLFDEPLILLGEDGENILSRNARLAFQVTGKIWVNNHAHVLRPDRDIMNISYLTEYLESLDYRDFNTGTAQPKLNKKTCFNIPVVVPSKNEQTAIAAVLSDMDAEISALAAKREKTAALKQGMMQELLTGKTRLV